MPLRATVAYSYLNPIAIYGCWGQKLYSSCAPTWAPNFGCTENIEKNVREQKDIESDFYVNGSLNYDLESELYKDP
jgi:hypothetical protein